MKKTTLVIVADYSNESFITFEEIVETFHVSSDFINDLIEYEIIEPKTTTIEERNFTLTELQKIKTAIRLQRDLEMNPPGIKIVIDLLEQLKELRIRNELLEKHLLK
jgi:chaperone modulatory protein CbpM